MKNILFSRLHELKPWRHLLDGVGKTGVTALSEVPEPQRAFLSAALALHTGRQVLYVAPSEHAAMRAAADCGQLLQGRAAALPAADLQFIRSISGREAVWKRLSVLDKALSGDLRVLCISAEVLLQRFLPAQVYREQTRTLFTGDAISFPEIARYLASVGYERADMVEGRGQWAQRGDILDLYPPCSDHAVRVEFFDTSVDTIRAFDWVTQRSLFPMDAVSITPANEYFVQKEHRQRAYELMQAIADSAFSASASRGESCSQAGPDPAMAAGVSFAAHRALLSDAMELRDRGTFRGIHLWAHRLLASTVMLTDWLKDPIVVVDTPDRVAARAADRSDSFGKDLRLAVSRGAALSAQSDLLRSAEEALQSLLKHPVVTMQEMLRGSDNFTPDKVLELRGVGAGRYRGRFGELSEDLASWSARGFTVAVFAGGGSRAERVREALKQQGRALDIVTSDTQTTGSTAFILPQPLSGGFVMESAGIVVLSDAELFPSGQSKARKAGSAGERISAFTDLDKGDYIVHEHHGIGIYRGVTRLQSEGAYRDYLHIQYRGNDKLYVPVDQFDRIQKYIGSQGLAPALSNLGGGEWDKQKKKVSAGLQRLAINLVSLYARRQSAQGFSFEAHPAWEAEFADGFDFELTRDQQQAVSDVLGDMARPVNMDRLLCGDVGYGKTEVAMRAAFRALINSKQTAFLAPTTILVQQHYHTLKKRFEGLPARIDYVSRFRTPSENRRTISLAREGKVDILVGTHRLLSKDVAFSDLGLLIVDEEQRFGVAHKEIIKNLKKNLDVLTLSATPIPRTLHMSMVGVRDMSLLETPPDERYPVQTHVTDYSESLVRDAILREIARGGQVFFLYNRVEAISRFALKLRALVPEARIAVAHGQMNEQALEDIMADFYQGKHDVLLCTTIIENGIDIPRANTLFVFDADRFGLSQLYQLRGRVGRSNRLAYAYFMVRPEKIITESAEKRLSAIREFTEFGSGFRVAMRDLEIRGSGNIFGPEQSGLVNIIGYDLYCKLIEEAVREARGDVDGPRDSRIETRVDLHVNAYLPEEYIPGVSQRMEIYKRISLVRSDEDRRELIDELVDRFGEPGEPVINLVDIALLRALSQRVGADYVTAVQGSLSLRLNPSLVRDPALLVSSMASCDPRLTISSGKKPAVFLGAHGLTEAELLHEGIEVFSKLLSHMQGAALQSEGVAPVA